MLLTARKSPVFLVKRNGGLDLRGLRITLGRLNSSERNEILNNSNRQLWAVGRIRRCLVGWLFFLLFVACLFGVWMCWEFLVVRLSFDSLVA